MTAKKYTSSNLTRNRIVFAATRLQRFGECGDNPDSRAFDECFEMGDGDLVVKGLIELAATEPYLARGIRYLGGNCLDEWIAKAGISESEADHIRERAGISRQLDTEHALPNSLALALAS